METMMGRMQIMEQKQGSLQDQISSMREVNCASAVVMDGIERRQEQMLDFLQQQTEESSQALQGVREQLLEQSKLIQQQATDRQETYQKEPVVSKAIGEEHRSDREVVSRGASHFDAVLTRGHTGSGNSTPMVHGRPPFPFPPPRPHLSMGHMFPPHFPGQPEGFFTGPGFKADQQLETAEDFSDEDESAGDGNQLETQDRRTGKDKKP